MEDVLTVQVEDVLALGGIGGKTTCQLLVMPSGERSVERNECSGQYGQQTTRKLVPETVPGARSDGRQDPIQSIKSWIEIVAFLSWPTPIALIRHEDRSSR